MKAQALPKYQIPQYPSKKEAQEQPQLLKRCVSTRWQKLIDAGLSGALLASISLAGCKEKPATNAVTGHSDDTTTVYFPSYPKIKNVNSIKTTALVAPIFEHGEGRGSIGCISVAPPVFISEEEAMVIIKEELSKNGIAMDKKKILIKEVKIQPGTPFTGNLTSQKVVEAKPLEIDLQDSNKSINVEFVSQQDYVQLGGQPSLGSVSGFDMKKVAKQVRNQIQLNTKQGVFGVFYDPLPSRWSGSPSSKQRIEYEQSKTEARDLLRQQVQDFANWLKEQKVI
jgi:hypothetical protein